MDNTLIARMARARKELLGSKGAAGRSRSSLVLKRIRPSPQSPRSPNCTHSGQHSGFAGGRHRDTHPRAPREVQPCSDGPNARADPPNTLWRRPPARRRLGIPAQSRFTLPTREPKGARRALRWGELHCNRRHLSHTTVPSSASMRRPTMSDRVRGRVAGRL